MRFAAIETIYKAAVKNKNIFFLTGDLNHAMENEFRTTLCDQYLNVGIAEQNMAGIAAGLALSGMKVFVYSIVPFVTMRCFEQIKADICYQNLDVTIVGVGGGFSYGQYGNTHCSIEDIAVMRVLPNMKVLCPANPLETTQLTEQAIQLGGPTYIRIGRGKEPMPVNEYQVKIGKGHVVTKGTDGVIFTTGTILTECEKAQKLLQQKGILLELVQLHTVKPIDIELIKDKMIDNNVFFTVEEHNIIGGLGSAVAEILSENSNKKIIFKRFGVEDVYLHEIGKQEYLRDKHGISSMKLVERIQRYYEQK